MKKSLLVELDEPIKILKERKNRIKQKIEEILKECKTQKHKLNDKLISNFKISDEILTSG